jgi:hypothetical protein
VDVDKFDDHTIPVKKILEHLIFIEILISYTFPFPSSLKIVSCTATPCATASSMLMLLQSSFAASVEKFFSRVIV